jgi:hypothetical protein
VRPSGLGSKKTCHTPHCQTRDRDGKGGMEAHHIGINLCEDVTAEPLKPLG